MLASAKQEWGYIKSNVSTQRISNAWGTSVTPGTSGSYGSYTEILSSSVVAVDCYWLDVFVHLNNASTVARATVMTIGVDPAGGTSWSTLIADLLVGCAGRINTQILSDGIKYSFPVFIPAGSSVACKMATEAASAGTPYVILTVRGRPKYPENLIFGQGVETIGITGTGGVSVTPGTTSDGTWTSLGTTARKGIFVQTGFGISNATMAALEYAVDLAADNDGTNPKIIIEDAHAATTSLEAVTYRQPDGYCDIPASTTIYGRMQCSGTPDSGITQAAYVVY